ncbi:hypothetical protein RJT34_12101 [Clitoria ternatea]|uniref:Uncharacterized protein n=1 Tax=Clitoria ternatea TaxID=43366 RepID=A0AAN9JL63_CLITE
MVWVIRRGGWCWWVGGRCGERRVRRCLDGVGHSLYLDSYRGRQLLFITLSAAPLKSKIHLDNGNPSQQGYSVGIWVRFHLLSIIRVEKILHSVLTEEASLGADWRYFTRF